MITLIATATLLTAMTGDAPAQSVQMKLRTTVAENVMAGSSALLLASSDKNESPLPVPQDPDSSFDKAKPADEMLGDTAPNGTELDVDPDSATVDGVPRGAESSFVNTDKEEAEVGIPNSED